jgi:hypothetical protein
MTGVDDEKSEADDEHGSIADMQMMFNGSFFCRASSRQ